MSEPRRVGGEHGEARESRRGGDISAAVPAHVNEPAQPAAVSFLARYSGATHALHKSQSKRWFGWCETNELDPLVGIQRAHVELYVRQLGETGLKDSSVNTTMQPFEATSDSLTVNAPLSTCGLRARRRTVQSAGLGLDGAVLAYGHDSSTAP